MNTVYIQTYVLPAGEKRHTYEHKLGRRLLCLGLKEVFRFDTTPEWLKEHIHISDGTKPFIDVHPEFNYNISHCHGIVVCALSPYPVGVDVESPRPVRESLLRRILTAKERLIYDEMAVNSISEEEWLLRFWTLKESYLKYTGAGLAGEPAGVSFSFMKQKPGYTGDQDRLIICSDPAVSMYQWTLPENRILSVCTGKKEIFTLRFLPCE